MKKILLGISLFFLLSVEVDAAGISLSDVKDKLKSTDLYNEFAQDSVNCSITSSKSSFDIICNLTDGVYKTHFDFTKGVLYYQFDGNKSSANTYEETLFDGLWIVQLTDVVADLNGIEIGDNIYKQSVNLFSNTYNYNEHGVEFTYFDFNTGSESGKAINTFKLYVNDGSVSENTGSSNSNNESNTSTQNPSGSGSNTSNNDKDVSNDTVTKNPNSGDNSSSNISKPDSNNSNTSNSNNSSVSSDNTNSNTTTNSSDNSNTDNTNVMEDKKDNNDILDIFFPNFGKSDVEDSSVKSTNPDLFSYIIVGILILIIIVTFVYGQKANNKK